MKFKTVIVLLLIAFACCYQSQAQGQFRKPLRSSSQSRLGNSNYNIGLKIGCPWSYMPKSDLKATTYEGNIGYLAGLIVERNFGKLSVSAESTLAQKGTNMYNEKPYQISLLEAGIVRTTFSVAYNVVTLRLPVTYYFKGMIKDDKIVPYVYAGPEIDLALPFNFDLKSMHLDSVTAITQKFDGPTGEDFFMEKKTSFRPPINICAVAGLGIMSGIRIENNALYFKLDAAINYGFRNLADANFKSQEGSIHSHDIEINFSIVYPIKKILHDACYNFRK